MGRTIHDAWDGFDVLRNAKNVIYGAKCKRCQKVYHKRDKETLMLHRKKCKGVPESAERRESYSSMENAENVSPNMNILSNDSNNSNISEVLDQYSSCNSSLERCESIVSNEKKNLLLMKFFLITNLKLEYVESEELKELLSALDPSYTIPPISYFQENDYKIIDEFTHKLHSFNYLKVAAILVDKNEEEIFASCVAMTHEKKYVYIDSCLITEHLCDVKKELQNFCDSCFKLIFDQLKIQIMCMIIDAPFSLNIESEIKINDQIYFRIPCLTLLLNALEYKHEPFMVRGSSDLQSHEQYYNKIKELREKFKNDCQYLGDATEQLFLACNDNNFVLNDSVSNIILEYLTPIAFLANFLNHNYKGHLFVNFPPLNLRMLKFIPMILPKNCFDAFASYKHGTHSFKDFTDKSIDSHTYWKLLKVSDKQNEDFATFSLDIISIPATTRKINLKKCRELIEQMKDKTRIYKQCMLYSVINS